MGLRCNVRVLNLARGSTCHFPSALQKNSSAFMHATAYSIFKYYIFKTGRTCLSVRFSRRAASVCAHLYSALKIKFSDLSQSFAYIWWDEPTLSQFVTT